MQSCRGGGMTRYLSEGSRSTSAVQSLTTYLAVQTRMMRNLWNSWRRGIALIIWRKCYAMRRTWSERQWKISNSWIFMQECKVRSFAQGFLMWFGLDHNRGSWVRSFLPLFEYYGVCFPGLSLLQFTERPFGCYMPDLFISCLVEFESS